MSSLRAVAHLALLGPLAFSLVACDSGGERCVTGITISCPCLGGSDGIQVCGGDGTFGACMCATADGGAGDSGTPSDGGPGDAGETSDAGVDAGTVDGGSDAGLPVTYGGLVPTVSAVWASAPAAGGLTGLEAGHSSCQAIGADHACDYEEVHTAELRGELADIPAGTTAWLQRTTTVLVSGTPSAPGPGGNCNNWTYITNHIGDGEYITFDVAGVPTYHFDNDTIYDPTMPGHAIPGDLECGGVMRAILCCYAAP